MIRTAFLFACGILLLGAATGDVSAQSVIFSGGHHTHVYDRYFGFSDGAFPAPPIRRIVTGLPTDSVGDGTFGVSALGDFNLTSEWLEVDIDGVSFGRLWDNNPNNDRFTTLANADQGRQYSPSWGNVTIPELELDSFLADGQIVIDYRFGPRVHDLSDNPNEYIRTQMDFDYAIEPEVVPEPATIVVWSLLGLTVGVCRLRKKVTLGKDVLPN